MSSTFSFSRLGKLMAKQLFENSRLYIFSVLALFGLLSLVFAFWIGTGAPDYQEEETYGIFLFGLFIAGTVFASMSFNMLGSKDKGIYWLSVPATHLEKLICTIFYTTALFTLAYCLVFYIVKSLAIVFLAEFIKKHPGSSYREMTDFKNGFGSVIKYFIYGYFAVQSLYLLGSVYFRRYSFIITTVAGAFLIFVFAYYMTRIHDNMLGAVSWDLISVRKADKAIKDGYMLYSVSPTVAGIFKYTIQFVWVPVFWVATWFRLKEKEI
ncbi:MAG: hypothetical protein JWQ40_1658 [Segetibacter sp.]|jgi:hypothetical protein|nr:hypothetical protein [Segetibacter sp.]